VLIDKDEDKTIAQIRAGIKAERKQYISVRPSTTAVQNNPTTVPANATQLIDVNKFIDQQVILCFTAISITHKGFSSNCYTL